MHLDVNALRRVLQELCVEGGLEVGDGVRGSHLAHLTPVVGRTKLGQAPFELNAPSLPVCTGSLVLLRGSAALRGGRPRRHSEGLSRFLVRDPLGNLVETDEADLS